MKTIYMAKIFFSTPTNFFFFAHHFFLVFFFAPQQIMFLFIFCTPQQDHPNHPNSYLNHLMKTIYMPNAVFVSCLSVRRWSCRNTWTRVRSSTWSRPERVSSRASLTESEPASRALNSLTDTSSASDVSQLFRSQKLHRTPATPAQEQPSTVIISCFIWCFYDVRSVWTKQSHRWASASFRDAETKQTSRNQTDLQRPEKRDHIRSFPDLSSLFIHLYTLKCFTCSLLLVACKPRDWRFITSWTSRASDQIKSCEFSSVPNPSESSN